MDVDEKVKGRDGKSYPATPDAGRARYPRILELRAEGKSLRTIAAEVGCSVNTVRRAIGSR